MCDLNSINIIGRVASELELKHTKSQKAVVSFRVAVDAGYAAQDGSRQAYFFDVVAWEGTAQFVTMWFEKGQPIGIAGKLQTRSWTDKYEQKRVSVEIVAQNVYFCGDARRERSAAAPARSGESLPASAAFDSPLSSAVKDSYAYGEQQRFDYRNDFRPMEEDDDVPF